MEILLSVCIGIGLSAACGFRVFVPFLIMSIAAQSGHLDLTGSFAWVGTPMAMTAFAVASGLEVLGYYIPFVGHLLDVAATPAAVVAGIVATAAIATGLPPLLTWSVALIAGGGVAGATQTGTMAARSSSTLFTAGLGTPLVATGELIGAALTAILAIMVPVAVVALVVVILVASLRWRRRRQGRAA